MKYFLIGLIKTYQMIPLPTHGMCKYTPSCSNYAIESITLYGALKGSYISIKRILRCGPFTKGGYDPVVKKEVKK